MLKKSIITILSLALSLSSGMVQAVQASQPHVKVSVNGKAVSFPDAKPFINKQNHTIVPVRFVTEHLGYEVAWNAAKQTVNLRKGNQKLYFKIGQYGSEIHDSRTYVPLRYVAEAFGAEVQWNGKNRLATILTEDLITDATGPVTDTNQTDVPSETSKENNHRTDWQSKADDVLALAEKYYGVDYLLGAKTGRTDAFDCSSFTQYVFWKSGIKLKRESRPQFLEDGDKVLTRNELRRGDLVFFSTALTAKKYEKGDYRQNGHVGIVKEVKANGEIVFIHTFKKGIGVTDSKMYADLNKGWWNDHFLYGKRVIADDGSEALDVKVDKSMIAAMTSSS